MPRSQGLNRKQPGLVCASAVIKRRVKKGINDLIEEWRKRGRGEVGSEAGDHTDSGRARGLGGGGHEWGRLERSWSRGLWDC